MGDALAGLQIKFWYHALMALGGAGCIASLAFPMHGVANAHVFLAALGMFFVGLGEWVNHPFQQRVGMGFTISGHPRKPCILGALFDLLGAGLLGLGIYKIVVAA